MKYLLDTCLISELVKPQPNRKVMDWLNSVPEHFCVLSVLTLGELRKGISKLSQSKKKTALEGWLHSDLCIRFEGRLIPIDQDVALAWGKLSGQAELQGVQIPVIDGLLAATALSHQLVLVTRNVADFKATGVELLNPWG